MLNVIAAYDSLIISINNNIKTLKAYPKILSEESHKKYFVFFDKCLYNALIQNDLLIGLKYLDVSNALKNQIEANYFARTVALSSYETFNYLDKLVGKDVKTFLESNGHQTSYNTISAIAKKVNSLKKSCFTYLEEIRNNVIGHKDSHALKQTFIMLQIDNAKIHRIGTDLYKLNFELLNEYANLMTTI
jgi:hypothetical protein